METRMVMKGNHSRKTAAFVRVSPSLPPLTEEEELCVFNCRAVFFFFPPRPVLPTVSSPFRRSATSSAVSTFICCPARLRWRTSVSLRVRGPFASVLHRFFPLSSSQFFIFSFSRRFPESSGQCPTRGSSLHQRGGKASLL